MQHQNIFETFSADSTNEKRPIKCILDLIGRFFFSEEAKIIQYISIQRLLS